MVIFPSWRSLVSQLLVLTLLCLAVGIFVSRIVAAGLWAAVGIWLWLLYRSRFFELEGFRLTAVSGVLLRTRREVNLRDLLYLSLTRGPGGQLAGYCTLVFHLPSSSVMLRGIPVSDAEALRRHIAAQVKEA